MDNTRDLPVYYENPNVIDLKRVSLYECVQDVLKENVRHLDNGKSSQGHVITADEVIGKIHKVKVPIKPLEEFENKLPDSGLLELIHYYFSSKYSHLPLAAQRKVLRSMDETALISLGLLVEDWIDEMIGEGYRCYEKAEGDI